MNPTPHPESRHHPQAYTRADAIADGLQIEVPARLSRQFGIPWPLVVSTLAWFDAVAWDTTSDAAKPQPTGETESARIAEVLWAAQEAVNGSPTGACDVPFTVHRVPPVGSETRSTPCALLLSIHPGDHGETVATIHHPHPCNPGHDRMSGAPETPADTTRPLENGNSDVR